MQLSVAVLEDDRALRDDILVPELQALGFRAEGFAHSAGLYERMRVNPFDLAVIDIALDGEYGLDVAQRLRAMALIGIVTLTGRAVHSERIIGLRESIDAWLTKPVEIELLAATLHSVSRRLHPRKSPSDRASAEKSWQLTDNGWHLQSPDGREMSLNLAERRVLTRLFLSPNEPVLRESLISVVAEPDEDFDPHRLDMLIHRLRRKIVRSFGMALPLRAVRGCGYLILGGDSRSR